MSTSGSCGDLGHELGDVPAGVRLQPDRDHGLDRTAERGRVDVGVVAADHAALAQGAHPAQAGRRRDADPFGQRVVRHPRVGRRARRRSRRSMSSERPTERCSAASARSGRVRRTSAMAQTASYRIFFTVCSRSTRRSFILGPQHARLEETRDEGRRPPRGQEQRVPGRDHPGRRARAGPARSRGRRRARGRRRLGDPATTTSSRAGAQILPTADDVWGSGGHGAQGQGADRRGVPPDAQGPGAVHLPAPRRRQGRAPTRCSPPARPASPTRPSSCPTARCRCSPRCPRSPGGSRRRSARTT